MAERDLVAFEFIRRQEERLPPVPGTPEARRLPHLFAGQLYLLETIPDAAFFEKIPEEGREGTQQVA